MRTVVLGIVVVITGLVIAAVAAPGPEGTGRERGGLDRVEGPCPRGVLPRSIAANNDLIAATTIVGDQYQMVTVIDTKLRVMSVYQIELASGKISLRKRTAHSMGPANERFQRRASTAPGDPSAPGSKVKARERRHVRAKEVLHGRRGC